jgi:6,7-dimethyl-8-ribityllumazine synthase
MQIHRIPLSIDRVAPTAPVARIAVVVAMTNDFVTGRMLDGALGELQAAGEATVTVVEVAGAFELIEAAATAFGRGAVGVVALGAIIRGETPHFDYIATAVANGLARLAAEGKPVAFGVLTTDTVGQATDRAGGALGNKGAEAATALLQSLNASRRMENAPPHRA